MTEFAKWFASQRIARKFSSQLSFAKASGVGRATIASIESGNGFAHRHAETRTKIADALGLDVMEIIRKEREMRTEVVRTRKSDKIQNVKMRSATAIKFRKLAKADKEKMLDYFDWCVFAISRGKLRAELESQRPVEAKFNSHGQALTKGANPSTPERLPVR